MTYQKRYSSEPWYVAMRREQNEQYSTTHQTIQESPKRKGEPFLEESPLFNELKKKNPTYLVEHYKKSHSEKNLKVACVYLEGRLGLKEYRSIDNLAQRYGVSQISIGKTYTEVAKLLNYHIEKFKKGTRTKRKN